MSAITPEEMAIADENSEYLGVPRLLLMENAGRAVAEVVREKLPSDKRVVIVAGTGNNGGDGFACARHLAGKVSDILVVLLGQEDDIRTNEALLNWQVIERMRFHVKRAMAPDAPSLKALKGEIEGADAVIDAIFGTGIKEEIKEPFSTAIDAINSVRGLKVSIDVPSGLDPLSGEVHDKAVKSDFTITLHKMKPGLVGKEDIAGTIVVAPIGMPPEAEIIVGPGDVRSSVKSRQPYSKKGDFGRVLIVGGSKEYSGAPALAALAALKAGVDLAIVAAPKSVADVIRSFSPNLIVKKLGGEQLRMKDLPEVRGLVDRSSSIILGPGLGLEEETKEAILDFMREARKIRPIVVDADALKALEDCPACIANSPSVLTPHAGEFEIATHESLPPPEDLKGRVEGVMKVAKKLGITILLKAHEDVISDGQRYKVNMTGNPGMTAGGTGDVLSGTTAAFLAWGREPFRAACAGAFVSGVAGDLAVKDKGYHILATDVLEKIPEVLKRFEPS